MKNRRFPIKFMRIFSAILGFLLFLSPYGNGPVHAQDLEIINPALAWSKDPGTGAMLSQFDYGNVIAGQSRTVTFDLFSNGPSPVWIYVVALNEVASNDTGSMVSPWKYGDPQYALGAFSFNPSDPMRLDPPSFPPGIPRESPTGEHALIDILYSPPAAGVFEAYLHIYSNDSVDLPGTEALIHLQGAGIEASTVPEPASLLLVSMGLIGVTCFVWRNRGRRVLGSH